MPWYKSSKFLRPFYVSEYTPDGAGFLRVSKPKFCPLAIEGNRHACRIVISDNRFRKCGPGYKFAVLRCRVHKISFTAYPVGWTPFGRSALVDTVKAVLDLDANHPWPQLSNSRTPTRKTQLRWLKALAILLAIDPEISLSKRHEGSICLGVPAMTLAKTANQIRAGPTAKRRAQGILTILRSPLKPNWESIIQFGSEIGFWGKQYKNSTVSIG